MNKNSEVCMNFNISIDPRFTEYTTEEIEEIEFRKRNPNCRDEYKKIFPWDYHFVLIGNKDGKIT